MAYVCSLKCPHCKLGAQYGDVKVFRPLRRLWGHRPWKELIQFSQLSSDFLLCIRFWGGIFHRPTPQPHHGSKPPELWTKQNLFSSQTTQNRCFITVTQHGWTDSKRQRKGWSVSSLSPLAIFENLLVVRGSLPSSGVHSRWENDWQDSMGRVTCSQASCGNEEVDKHKQFTFSFFSFSFSTQKHETTH